MCCASWAGPEAYSPWKCEKKSWVPPCWWKDSRCARVRPMTRGYSIIHWPWNGTDVVSVQVRRCKISVVISMPSLGLQLAGLRTRILCEGCQFEVKNHHTKSLARHLSLQEWIMSFFAKEKLRDTYCVVQKLKKVIAGSQKECFQACRQSSLSGVRSLASDGH